MNRLKLNFDLPDYESRANFIDNYIAEWPHSTPPTEDEIEMMGNYILWGKDPKTGRNVVQDRLIEIDTKNTQWQRRKDDESLDALLETPTFNEGSIVRSNATSYKIPREVFDRKAALELAPSYLQETLTDLFNRIDRIDLSINYYDLAHNKRKNPPRPELLARFSLEEQNAIAAAAEKWNQRKYLQNKHLLVELRREQYTLRDTYSNPVVRHTITPQQMPVILEFDAEIPILPLGCFNSLIFRPLDELVPAVFSEKELCQISDMLWEKDNNSPLYFSFCELEHVYQLFNLYFEIQDEGEKNKALHIPSNIQSLLDALEYYISIANLNDIQKEILNMKRQKKQNQEIAAYINKKYGKSYTTNYISTIYRQKIIVAINEAATYHYEIISNLFFPENFKTCSCCGHTLLKSDRNFVKKSRAKDGYSNRCKKCDKEDRQRKKSI